jgi:predicted Zn finger-like uncharacterized protein
MRIACPECGARFRLDPSNTYPETVRLRCTKCTHVFVVKLPRENAAGSLRQVPPRIMVVDDARFFREMIVKLLEPLSATLLTAEDGIQALAMVYRERPDLLILDLNLPGMDGFALIRTVRADKRVSGLRILAMSGVFRSEEDISKASAAGADLFLPKSFESDQFLKTVRSLLEIPH